MHAVPTNCIAVNRSFKKTAEKIKAETGSKYPQIATDCADKHGMEEKIEIASYPCIYNA